MMKGILFLVKFRIIMELQNLVVLGKQSVKRADMHEIYSMIMCNL